MIWKWSELKALVRKRAGDDTSNLGAVMWPVHYPLMDNPDHQPVDPHITIIYFGEIDGDIGFTCHDVISAIMETQWNMYLWVRTEGVEWFGPDQDVPVLRVEHNYLQAYWERLKAVLRARGIPFDETYPEYKPHLTIPLDAALLGEHPSQVLVRPVQLWWGNVHYDISPGKTVSQVALNRDGSV